MIGEAPISTKENTAGGLPSAVPSLDDVVSLFCCEFYKGGCKGKYKAPFANAAPVDWTTARKRYRHIVGRIAPDAVMVDYDDQDIFDTRVEIAAARHEKCIAVKSSRGGHMYWKQSARFAHLCQDGEHTKTALTLYPVDFKSGDDVKKRFTALSLPDGGLREVVYCGVGAGETLDEMPAHDVPLWVASRAGRKKGEQAPPDIPNTPNFFDMCEGEGRNAQLFAHMIPCKRKGLSYDDFLQVAEIINEHVFLNPLDASEFKTVTRSEAWDGIKDFEDEDEGKQRKRKSAAPEDAKTTGGIIPDALYVTWNEKTGKICGYSLERFSSAFVTYYHAAHVNGRVHFYKDGVYTARIEDFELAFLIELSGRFDLQEHDRREIYKYLALIAPSKEEAPARYIAFKNCVLDVQLNQKHDFSPDLILTNRIPWDFKDTIDTNNPAYRLVYDFLLQIACDDYDIRDLLLECAGLCFYRDNRPFKMAFILFGDKHNGKSTFLDLLGAALGEENISSLDFKQLDGRFDTAELYGKLANLGDDISGAYIEETAAFKVIASGGLLKAEIKYQNPFQFRPFCKLIFAANVKPRLRDETGAALERLTIIPLKAHFMRGADGFDPMMRMKIIQPDAVQIFIFMALRALRRVLTTGLFTHSAAADAEKEDYRKINNPIVVFLEQYETERIQSMYTSDLYNRYTEYCRDNGHRQPMAQIAFTKAVCLARGLTTSRERLNGVRRYRFVPVEPVEDVENVDDLI